MAGEVTKGLDISRVADVDLSGSQHRVVAFSATGAALPGAAGAIGLGVLQNADATAGRAARIRIFGASKIEANGAFSAGDVLSVAATTGCVDTAISTHYPVARALGPATVQGQKVDAIVMPSLVPLA